MTETSVRAAVALGSNLGDRRSHLRAAVRALAASGRLVAVSSVYETEPVGGPPQGRYLNAVVVLDTALGARPLLDRCQEIERSRGRERRERWGPRTLDLDLVIFGDQVIDEPGLRVPHPRLAERRFVLAPLHEAWPDVRLLDGTPVADLLAGTGEEGVIRLGPLGGRSSRFLAFVAGAVLTAAAIRGVRCICRSRAPAPD